jgi:hypothetical protein
VPCPLSAQREDSQRPKNLSGHSRIAPLTLRYVCVFFVSTPMALAYATFCYLLLHASLAPETSVARDSGGGATARRSPFVRIALSLFIPAAARYFPVGVLTKCGWRRRTRPLATTCLPKAKTITAIGNNVFTEGEDDHGHWQQRVYRSVIFVLPTVCASQNLGMFLQRRCQSPHAYSHNAPTNNSFHICQYCLFPL